MLSFFHRGFRSVVVITSALHAEGRQFKPGRKQFFFKMETFSSNLLGYFSFLDSPAKILRNIYSLSIKEFTLSEVG